MKPSMIFVIILMIVLGVWLFPKREDPVWVDHGKVPIKITKIDLQGAVEFPGIYHVFEPLTVSDALAYGVKVLDEADLENIQLSEVITKDKVIQIPNKYDDTPEVKVLVNVNKASFKDLMSIPGITESRAASIIIYRETHGDFKNLDELINVKYIGVATLEKIKPYLSL